mgnify:CR=1 FL=1
MTVGLMQRAKVVSEKCWQMRRRHIDPERSAFGEAHEVIEALMAEVNKRSNGREVTLEQAFAKLDEAGWSMNGGQQKKREKMLRGDR